MKYGHLAKVGYAGWTVAAAMAGFSSYPTYAKRLYFINQKYCDFVTTLIDKRTVYVYCIVLRKILFKI